MSMYPVGTRVMFLDNDLSEGYVVGYGTMTGYAFNPDSEPVYLVRLDKGGYVSEDTYISTIVAHPDSIVDVEVPIYDGPYKASPGGW